MKLTIEWISWGVPVAPQPGMTLRHDEKLSTVKSVIINTSTRCYEIDVDTESEQRRSADESDDGRQTVTGDSLQGVPRNRLDGDAHLQNTRRRNKKKKVP